MNLLQLLKSLQRQKRGLAVVLDEFGGTAGLITVEDILDKVVGHIHQEVEPAVSSWRNWGKGAGALMGRCHWTILAGNIRNSAKCRASIPWAGCSSI